MQLRSSISRYIHALAFVLGAGLLTAGGTAWSQESVFVNTDNLLLRDRPEREYRVLAVLHTPCRLKTEPYERGYSRNKAVTAKFYMVSVSFLDQNNISHYISGWVEKRYVTGDSTLVPTALKGAGLRISLVPGEPGGESPPKMNWRDFPGPEYKGGENAAAPLARVYRKGPRGGCYYLGKNGRKIYVDKRFCTGK